jgi:phosphopantetheinyl transferase (holo-ACP synthase)
MQRRGTWMRMMKEEMAQECGRLVVMRRLTDRCSRAMVWSVKECGQKAMAVMDKKGWWRKELGTERILPIENW